MENRIESVKNKVVDVELHVEDFATIVQEEFDDLGVEVTVNEVEDFPENMMSVNGYFNAYEYDLKENIELALIVADEDGTININTDSWNFLQHQMRQTLEHEMIHREQVTERDGLVVMPVYDDNMGKEEKRIVYLSDPDEIGAYANDIVLDLLRTYTNFGAGQILQTAELVTKNESPILYEYVELFGSDSDIVKEITSLAMKRISN